MKKILIIVLLSITLCGCSQDKTKEKKDTGINYQEILKDDNYVIIDVRTKEEYDSGHIKDAIHIPYEKIDNQISIDKNKTILVYCKSGARSRIAYEAFKSLGYQVYDLGAYDSILLPKE